MKLLKYAVFLVALAVSAAVGACSSDSETAPEEQEGGTIGVDFKGGAKNIIRPQPVYFRSGDAAQFTRYLPAKRQPTGNL